MISAIVAGHAFKTLLAILSLLVLPWVLIFAMAALGSYLRSHLSALRVSGPSRSSASTMATFQAYRSLSDNARSPTGRGEPSQETGPVAGPETKNRMNGKEALWLEAS